MFEALEDLEPGDTVKMKVNRLMAFNDEVKMKEVTVTVTLQSSVDLEKKQEQELRFEMR